jgi:rubrerythrin
VDAKDWNPDEFNVKLSENTRKNLEAALKLELGNAAFYECAKNAADKEKDHYSFAKFKALMKVEKEHAAAISKFLKISAPDLEKQACAANAKVNTKEGFERENRAIKSYSKFRDEAVEQRLKEFFGALVEIETDHLDLHSSNLK